MFAFVRVRLDDISAYPHTVNVSSDVDSFYADAAVVGLRYGLERCGTLPPVRVTVVEIMHSDVDTDELQVVVAACHALFDALGRVSEAPAIEVDQDARVIRFPFGP